MDHNKGYFLGKNAVVTGAASGIGLALCESLLAQGAVSEGPFRTRPPSAPAPSGCSPGLDRG